MKPHDRFTIRPMRRDEIDLAIQWAEAEDWKPGLADAACFGVVDPGGFLIGELDGLPAATISAVNYDGHFAFLGFYIVRPDLRGRGFGWRIWQAAMAHAAGRTVGLDGVVAQQENYRKSGFTLEHRNMRYGGLAAAAQAGQDTIRLKDVPLPVIVEDEARVFPASRQRFLQAWIGSPGHVGRGLLRNGRLLGWGVVRPCRKGFRVGPLYADGPAVAETLLHDLLADIGGGEVFIDVPQHHHGAVRLAESLGLEPKFETARMYTGDVRVVEHKRIFGITTLEIG